MTITMSAKHQITIPKKIASALGLKKGAIFNVEINDNKIELVPLEVVEKQFTDGQYAKLEKLFQEEKGKTRKASKKFIGNLKEGKV